MRLLDTVRVKNDNIEYKKYNISKGQTGTIIEGAIRDNCFLVAFENKGDFTDTCVPIKLEDLELVEDNHTTDALILDDLPLHNPDWWCIVEDGFIKNLKGEKKNSIPFDYNS